MPIAKAGTNSVLELLEEYCRLHSELNWRQEPYKRDLFKVFSLAYKAKLTGVAADSAYKQRTAKLKRKKISPDDFVITGELIVRRVSKRYRRIAREIGHCWDEWAYAWDRCPNRRRAYHRRNTVKAKGK